MAAHHGHHPLIYVGNGNADVALAAAQVRTAAAFEVEHVATALAMVRHGLGVAVIASSTLAGADTSGLAVVPVRGDAVKRRIGIIQKKGRPLGAASRAFIAQLLEEADPPPARAARDRSVKRPPGDGAAQQRPS